MKKSNYLSQSIYQKPSRDFTPIIHTNSTYSYEEGVI